MPDPVFEIFREEARDHLAALEKGFLDLEAAEADARRALIDHLFRHAHSVKSDAKVVGLGDLKRAAQELEDVLDELREAPERVDRSAIDLSLKHLDRVRGAFEAWQSGDAEAGLGEPQAGEATQTAAPPQPAEEAPAPPERPAPPRDEAAPAPLEETFTVKVPSDRLDRMLNLTGEIGISQRSAEAASEQLGELRGQLQAIGKSLGRRSPAETRQALEAALDQVRRIEGALRTNHSREEVLVESLENEIRQARLLPLAMLADLLRRVVRDLAQSLGKEIRYEAGVGAILLDKAVIEALRDPLTHLVRNAADHGLEPPAERRAAGKPEAGLIRISASQRGPMVRIVVSDDGRGIDFDQVRRRLGQIGAADDAQLREMTDVELTGRLFQPGFSTAAAGEISGRGVGLDVVHDTMRRLQGQVELESQPKAGARFILTVPVTVATVRILTVIVGGQYYGVPSTSIVRTGRASPDELHELEGCRVLPVEGEPVRWIPLAELLGAPAAPRSAAERASSYLLIDRQGKRLAAAVDELEDETEVLLKPLGFPLQRLPGVLGAAIRADGSIQLVLDLAGPAFTQAATAPAPLRPAQAPKGRILIVDDSPTTRAVLRNVFTAAGYAVRTATDGMDALERLRLHPADVVISDVEMPRLGGFDLTRQIKARYGLPVILVTGKEREEHRREGLAAGADAYIVKSTFEGEGLLDVVRQFV
jgi:two-component system, chemotaxis family, sensor kinase CheA